MLPAKKHSISKNIEKINSGNFDNNDVNALLMSLRHYASENRTFKEFADFVAHPIRNQGEIKTRLDYLQDWSKFANKYLYGSAEFNFSNPFPKYILKILKYLHSRCDPNIFSHAKISKTSLKSFLEKCFDNIDEETITLNRLVLENYPNRVDIQEHISALNYLLEQSIFLKPLFHQEEIIQAVIDVLTSNKIHFNELLFRKQSDKIMLYILADLHLSTYTLHDRSELNCHIGGIEYRIKDMDNRKVIRSKYLYLIARSEAARVDIKGVELPLQHSCILINTTLPAYRWCNPSLFINLGSSYGSYNDQDFYVDNNYKLASISPYQGEGIVDITFHID
ncbi:hypothetical protein GCM10027275_13800 [Rhabdobacter roseus]|uniref:Uncharacterized protein n=1 Tax=Rhabdobacter roseus TaxID=1655419 RepID=A0A840TTE2_9BACT|nr:hypothetical protein [Rhabdobacter roseus]MBB5283298.1 hypothetical protein [Rhabdobacter roseus]